MRKPEGNTQRRNLVLAARLAETGLTQSQLADAVNKVVEEITGAPGRAGDRWVRMLIDGSIQRPRSQYRKALEIILGASINELGFQGSPDEESIAPEPSLFSESQTRIGSADVMRMRAPLGQLMSAADGRGAATLAPEAIRRATACQELLRNALVSERVERAMYALIGDYLGAAGWFALDNGDFSTAQRHLDAGLRAAGIARQGSLQAYVWSMAEKCARLRGDHSQALAMARLGLASATARRDPQVRGAFHALTAVNLSRRGELRQAQRSLARAFDTLNSAATRPSERWSFANHGFLAAIGASLSLTLGQLQDAERYGRQALEATRHNQRRNYAVRELSLARIYVEMGELDAACTHAASVLALAERIDSCHLVNRLERMHHLLVRSCNASVVRDWSAQYREFRTTRLEAW